MYANESFTIGMPVFMDISSLYISYWSTPNNVLKYMLANVTFDAHMHAYNATFEVRILLLLWHSMVYICFPRATLGCGVFSCHSNLVNHVRGSMSAPSVKSVAHRAVCSEISSSSDVKSYSNQRVIYHKPKSSNCLNTQRE